MGTDISGVRFEPRHDRTGVVLQQGRLLLDSDWNELVGIIDRRLRAAAIDLGSPGPRAGTGSAAVVPATTPHAFRIDVDATGTLTIGTGRCWVDGLLVDNHGSPDTLDPLLDAAGGRRGDEPVRFDCQPYQARPETPTWQAAALVYLDVWQCELTHHEEPGLVDPAIGIDTTARTQLVWQVRLLALDAPFPAGAADEEIPGWPAVVARSAGRATSSPAPVTTGGDCLIAPEEGYRHNEAVTYRIEIVEVTDDGATVTWARDNASITSRVVEVVAAHEVRPASLGRDEVLGFRPSGRDPSVVIEIVSREEELEGRHGFFVEAEVTTRGTLRWSGGPEVPDLLDAATPRTNLRVRRWAVLPTTVGPDPIPLERGLQVTLSSPGGRFHPGDHWLLAARPGATQHLVDAPPLGVHHHFSRLALLHSTDDGRAALVDLRRQWPEETVGCCTVSVSATDHADGWLTVQQAVDRVSRTGGRVCLGPGTFALERPIDLSGSRDVTLAGAGTTTVLMPRDTAVLARECVGASLTDLAIVSTHPDAAVVLETTSGVLVERCTITVDAQPGEEQPAPAAVALAGVTQGLCLRGSTIVAPVAVRPDPGRSALLTAHVDIVDNMLVAELGGVLLDGAVAHLRTIRIRRNTVLRAVEAGLRLLGHVGPEALVEITGNTVRTVGPRIMVAPGSHRITRNIVVGATDEFDRRSDGIAVVPSSLVGTRGAVTVAGNEIRDVDGVGIAVHEWVETLMVQDNVIERSRSGIRLTDRAGAGSVRLHGNVLRDVAPAPYPPDGAAIQVVGAERVQVSDMVLDGFSTTSGEYYLTGLRVLGCADVRISDVNMSGFGPDGATSAGLGILVNGPLERATVERCSARAPVSGAPRYDASEWTGLRVQVDDGFEYPIVTGLTDYVTVTRGGTHLIGSFAIFSRLLDEATAVVSNNNFQGEGAGQLPQSELGSYPSVQIWVRGDALVHGNAVRRHPAATAAALQVSAATATVTNNRVRGGQPAIQVDVAREYCALFGNLRSGDLTVTGTPLDPGDWGLANPIVPS